MTGDKEGWAAAGIHAGFRTGLDPWGVPEGSGARMGGEGWPWRRGDQCPGDQRGPGGSEVKAGLSLGRRVVDPQGSGWPCGSPGRSQEGQGWRRRALGLGARTLQLPSGFGINRARSQRTAAPTEEGSVDPQRHHWIPRERRGPGPRGPQSSSQGEAGKNWIRSGGWVDPRGQRSLEDSTGTRGSSHQGIGGGGRERGVWQQFHPHPGPRRQQILRETSRSQGRAADPSELVALGDP